MRRIVTGFLLCATLMMTAHAAAPEEKISITFDNTPLRTALKQLQELSGTEIIFNDALVAGTVINRILSDMNIEQALKITLKGTGVTFEKLAEDHYVLIRQKSAQITGFVLDADSLVPIPHANIEVIGRGMGVAANDRGYFILSYGSAASCSLKISRVGFQPRILRFNPDIARNPIVILLAPDTLTTPHVIIRAREDHDDPQAIRPSQLSSLPFSGEPDAINMLGLLPGTRNDVSGINGFSISGGLPSQNSIYLDGIRLFRNDVRFRLLGSLSPDDLQEIRVLTGGYNARHGDALAGIVELTSKTGSFHETTGSVSFSPMAGRFALEVPLFSQASWRLSLRHHHSNNYLNTYYDDIFESPVMTGRFQESANLVHYHPVPSQTDYSFYDVLSKAVILPDARNAISFTFLTNASDIKQTAGTSRATAYDRNLGLSGRWLHEWGPQLSSTLLASYTSYRVAETQSNPRLGSFKNHIKNTNVKIDNVWKPNTSNHFMFGGIIKRYQLSGQRTENAQLFSLYAQHRWQILSLLEINYGLRMTQNLGTMLQRLEPRISVVTKLGNDFSITAAWGRHHQYFHQAEALSEIRAGKQLWYISDGRMRPAAEADHFQVSFKYRQPRYSLQAELFRRQIYHQELPAGRRVEGVVHGLNLELKKQKGHLTGWMNYILTTRTASLNEIHRFAIEAPQYFKIIAHYQLKRNWSFGATWHWATTQMHLIEPLASTAHSLNVSLNKNFNGEFFSGQFRLSVDNLYNHRNPFYNFMNYPEEVHLLIETARPGMLPSATLRFNF